jgi:hypothetical protein
MRRTPRLWRLGLGIGALVLVTPLVTSPREFSIHDPERTRLALAPPRLLISWRGEVSRAPGLGPYPKISISEAWAPFWTLLAV